MAATNPPPPPEKNQVSDMKAQVMSLMQKHNVDPQTMVKLGDFANAAIKDKTLWPMFKNAVVQAKLVDPASMKAGIDYKMLGQFVLAGNMVKGGAQ